MVRGVISGPNSGAWRRALGDGHDPKSEASLHYQFKREVKRFIRFKL